MDAIVNYDECRQRHYYSCYSVVDDCVKHHPLHPSLSALQPRV